MRRIWAAACLAILILPGLVNEADREQKEQAAKIDDACIRGT